MTIQRGSENGRRALLVLGSVILALFLLEFPALVGILDYRGIIGPARRWFSRDMRQDPELIHIRRPHSQDRGSAWGGDIVFGLQAPRSDVSLYHWDLRYDQYGLRNDHDLERADIAVIGDSFVEGITTPSQSLVTSVLARLRGVTVANLAQSNYGPQQELVLLQRYGLRLQPHIVVWMFSEGSDLSDTHGYRTSTVHQSFWQEFRARSFTQNLLNSLRVWRARHTKADAAQYSGVLHLPGGSSYTMYFAQSVKGDLTKSDLGDLNQAAGIIGEADRLATMHGARFIVGFVPTAFRALHEFCTFPAESSVGHWKANDMPQRLKEALQSAAPGAEFVDFTPALTEAARRGTIPYYRDDEHWSEAGHRIAAEALNQYLGGGGSSASR